MNTIFISYRREESAGHAGRIYDRLREKFGQNRVFIDVSAIEPGADFVEAIDHAVGSCAALLVVIGQRWLECTDASGRPRLDNPKDFIRLEVATALRRNIPVIPVLVQGAAMPGEDVLPEDLKPLARRHAIEINDTHWDSNLSQLIEHLERILGSKKKPKWIQWLQSLLQSGLFRLIGAIIALVVVLTGLRACMPAILYLLGWDQSRTTKMVTVPKVVGMPEREAVDRLRNVGFTAAGEQRTSPDNRPGFVFNQEPQAGATLSAGGRVILRVAKTPSPVPQQPSPTPGVQVVVPDVVGQSLGDAERILRQQGLQPGTITRRMSRFAQPGTVINQRASSGVQVQRGTSIDLEVAAQPSKIE